MGMQAHFRRSDLPQAQTPQGIGASLTNPAYGEWDIEYAGRFMYACSLDGENFWFDCGQRSTNQMHQIELLIAWRVCFQVS